MKRVYLHNRDVLQQGMSAVTLRSRGNYIRVWGLYMQLQSETIKIWPNKAAAYMSWSYFYKY